MNRDNSAFREDKDEALILSLIVLLFSGKENREIILALLYILS